MQEIWKPIAGWEKLYEISNMGNVRSLDRYVKQKDYYRFCKGQTIKVCKHKSGYGIVTLRNSGIQQVSKVHQLVMNTFNPNKSNKKLEINHIDGNPMNNKLENLEWCTHKQNLQHASKNNLLSIYKPIEQYDLQGNLIKHWDSMKQAREFYNYGINSLYRACNSKNGVHKGYIWRYANE